MHLYDLGLAPEFFQTVRKLQMNGWRPANTSSTDVCVWLFTFCYVAESCCDIAHIHNIYSSTFQRGYNVTLFMCITVITYIGACDRSLIPMCGA